MEFQVCKCAPEGLSGLNQVGLALGRGFWRGSPDGSAYGSRVVASHTGDFLAGGLVGHVSSEEFAWDFALYCHMGASVTESGEKFWSWGEGVKRRFFASAGLPLYVKTRTRTVLSKA